MKKYCNRVGVFLCILFCCLIFSNNVLAHENTALNGAESWKDLAEKYGLSWQDQSSWEMAWEVLDISVDEEKNKEIDSEPVISESIFTPAEDGLFCSEIEIKNDDPLSVDYFNSYAYVENQDSLQTNDTKSSAAAQALYQRMINQDATPLYDGVQGLTRAQAEEIVHEASVIDPIAYGALFGTAKVQIWQYTNTGLVAYLQIEVSSDPQAYKRRYSKLLTATDEAAAILDDTMSEEEIALALHDYLAFNNTYDQTLSAEETHSAYGALVNKTSVCEGYAKAYNLLMSRAGITCYMVTSEKMNHAWNMVRLGGKWYHVDVTFDDPIGMEPIPGVTLAAKRDYFLRNDSEMTTLGHSGWTWSTKASDTKYSNIPRDYSYNQPYINGYWYYTKWIDHKMMVCRADFFGKNEEPLFYGDNMATSFAVYDKWLYFADGQYIVAYNTESGQTTIIYELSEEERGDVTPDQVCIVDIYSTNQGSIAYKILQWEEIGGGSYSSRYVYHGIKTRIPIEKFKLEKKEINLLEGQSEKLTLQIEPTNASLQDILLWQSSDPSIATVDGGTVQALRPGTVEISVLSYYGYSQKCKVTVAAWPTDTVLGDVNADRLINASDALMDLRHSVKEITLVGGAFTCGDVDKDGNVNASDALQILRYSVKEISGF